MRGTNYTGPVMLNESNVWTYSTATAALKSLEEVDNGWQFTISIDTGEYPDTKQGYSKGTEENLACFRIGPVFIMWGKNE